MGTWKQRSDAWWAARYAKSQREVERERDRPVASEHEPQIPYVPASSTLVGHDGRRYMLRLIPPGEPLDHVGTFALTTTLVGFFTRGYVGYRDPNPFWIAVVERQRGPWRGFDRLEERNFEHYADAARFLIQARQRLESGEAT